MDNFNELDQYHISSTCETDAHDVLIILVKWDKFSYLFLRKLRKCLPDVPIVAATDLDIRDLEPLIFLDTPPKEVPRLYGGWDLSKDCESVGVSDVDFVNIKWMGLRPSDFLNRSPFFKCLDFINAYLVSLQGSAMLTKIGLFANNLTGEIPSELANQTLLQEFDISANHFSGKLPPDSRNCKSEEPDSFSAEQLSGKIPANSGRFSPLVSIEISENNFTGSFPRVNHNRLSGQLPEGIWAMPNVDIVDFSNNE
ncbi:probable LRR receptor-like serine/threonine-protein kinase At4g36180 [Chenopodium quinoa]|uniref:probable LRR receptor-like serine/threonine-protein kinase At4g36180 n=1 Tax=Chenopodium quinoa TaxID=63459 RepID=UPI000B797ACC|nr:probable LRR receptor-like serine/threonine-protein kinase At4g36180 [Chenopodium quinoa]